jgi:hypothetical protein
MSCRINGARREIDRADNKYRPELVPYEHEVGAAKKHRLHRSRYRDRSKRPRFAHNSAPRKGVPAALQRSRSGNGGHVWIFFSEPVSARTARQLGAAVLTETMERRPEIGFASYDRFFPSQDTMPVGGFGDLIALPSQRRARARVLSCAVRAFPTFDKPKQRFSTVPTDRGFVWR